MVIRKKFDDGLVRLAIENGATFWDGKTVTDIKILKNTTKILLDDGTVIESQIVIGADGIWSIVARKSGLNNTCNNIGICLFKECPLSRVLIDRYFTEKKLVYIHHMFQELEGYGWVFLKKEHVNIGIGEIRRPGKHFNRNVNLKTIYKNYISHLKKNEYNPKGS